MDATLTLRNDITVVGSATDFAWKWGLNAGMTEDDAARFALALDEVVTNVVLFAFGEESGEFSVAFRRGDIHAQAIVRENGIPFDPARHRYDPDAAREEGHFHGAGFHLATNLVDDFAFINRGRSGIEFRIAQRIEPPDQAEVWFRLDHPDVPVREAPDASAAPEETAYTYTNATAEDAEDIARLIFHTYGLSYTKSDVYLPSRLEATLENRDRIAVIARTDEGTPAGYFAMLRIPDTSAGEVGEAVVHPAHRRRGLMTEMLRRLIDVARKDGMKGVFAEPVTVHPFSQKVNHKFDMQTTALVLADFPTHDYRKLIPEYPQPVTVAVEFLMLDTNRIRRAYLPMKYRHLLMRIYADLGLRVEEMRLRLYTPEAQTDIGTTVDFPHQHATLVVRDVGIDFRDVMAQALEDLRDSGIHSVYVDLPMEHPGIDHAVEVLGKLGFVFSGLMPLFHGDADYLRLQHIVDALDFDLIETWSETAGAIKKRIMQELKWKSTGQKTG